MPQKSSGNNKTKRETSWHKTPSLIIAVISIASSALIGILSIVNSRSIARLDSEVYIPRLQYRIGPEKDGYIYIEVSNYGAASAKDVGINISWKSPIQLNQCSTQPPYQDIQPVQPIVDNNLTFRLSVLPIDSFFKVVCRIEEKYYFSSLPVFRPPPPLLVQSYGTTPAESTKSPTEADFEATFSAAILPNLDSRLLSPNIIMIQIFAENSRPAIEAGSQNIILSGTPVIVYGTPTAATKP